MNSSANLASCYAIVLAGGSGTRLWPLSRTLLPKQLLTLNDDKTLLCQTMERVGEFFPSQRTVVVTNEENVFEVRSQICSINSALENQAISEPMGRNTLPAIMLGLKRVVMHDPEAIVAVFPSDHLIKDIKAFGCCLEGAVGLMGDYDLVTFGIKPISPETGYGYVRKGRQIAPGAFEVEGFTEKPDIAKANEFLDSGNYFWNSGMFVFCASAFLEAVKQYAPVYSEWWDSTDESDLRLGYGNLPDMSVDYGVIEHMSSLAVIEATFDWDDLGNWEAIYRLGLKDVHGCVKRGDVLALDCENSLIISHGGKLAAVGMKNTILVQTSDATLVCPLSEVQKVKDVVGVLKSEGSQLVETHLTVKRPWGSYTVLEGGHNYKIKRIEVPSAGRLSFQMHHHRSEHWVVVSGTALVQLGDKEILLVENQSIDIPKTTPHRLSNPGKVPVVIIEIQAGTYLEEDDIVRFEDIYGRLKTDS